MRLRPQALSGPLVDDLRISGSRKILTIPVQFARDTDYQLTIFHAHSIGGANCRRWCGKVSRAVACGADRDNHGYGAGQYAEARPDCVCR